MVCENIFTAPPRPKVEDGAFSNKIDYVIIFEEFLNLEGHPNCITVSKGTAILLNWLILPIGGVSTVKVLRLQPAQQVFFFNLEGLCSAKH